MSTPPPPPPYTMKPPPPVEVAVQPAKGPSPLLIVGIVVGLFFALCCGCGGLFSVFSIMSANQALENDFEAIQRQLEEDQRQFEQQQDDWEE